MNHIAQIETLIFNALVDAQAYGLKVTRESMRFPQTDRQRSIAVRAMARTYAQRKCNKLTDEILAIGADYKKRIENVNAGKPTPIPTNPSGSSGGGERVDQQRRAANPDYGGDDISGRA